MDEDFYKALGRRIADLRKGKGLTQESLAEETEVGASYIARIETGSRKPTLDVLGQIASALGVPIWRLLADQRLTSGEKAWKRSARNLENAIGDLSRSDISLLTKIARRLKQ